jgi:hypothetical protein
MFTNDETSPGNIMRTPLSQTDDGEWEADPDNAINGGVVYRAELESDYNVSTLEPVIVGPDFTEEQAMTDVDNSLRNVDNVYAMRDGRVLCCEDGWRGANRSYPNDGMYVFQPENLAAKPSEGDVAEDDSDSDSTNSNSNPQVETSTPASVTDSPEPTTGGSGPGFGITSAAAAVGIGAYKYLQPDTDEE